MAVQSKKITKTDTISQKLIMNNMDQEVRDDIGNGKGIANKQNDIRDKQKIKASRFVICLLKFKYMWLPLSKILVDTGCAIRYGGQRRIK